MKVQSLVDEVKSLTAEKESLTSERDELIATGELLTAEKLALVEARNMLVVEKESLNAEKESAAASWAQEMAKLNETSELSEKQLAELQQQVAEVSAYGRGKFTGRILLATECIDRKYMDLINTHQTI